MQQRVIGAGQQGSVLHPSIHGDETKVTKVGLRKRMKREYDNIQMLPADLELYPDMSESTYEEEGKNGFLTIPYIHGTTLLEYLDSFKNVENSTNKYHPEFGNVHRIMGVDDFVNIFSILSMFYIDLMEFNSMGFQHGDISSTNIMYCPESNKLYLIDWYNLSKSVSSDDVDSFFGEVVSTMLTTALFNDEIFDDFLDKGIIELKKPLTGDRAKDLIYSVKLNQRHVRDLFISENH